MHETVAYNCDVTKTDCYHMVFMDGFLHSGVEVSELRRLWNNIHGDARFFEFIYRKNLNNHE